MQRKQLPMRLTGSDVACCINIYGMAREREPNKLRCNEAFIRDAHASKLSIIKHSLFYRLTFLRISLTDRTVQMQTDWSSRLRQTIASTCLLDISHGRTR